ncbi:MAG TPA: cytochrome P450, partial [Trebonia sp.]
MRPSQRVSLGELARDPHPALARLRERAPVCWVPELDAWLVTGYSPAVAVLQDPGTFTVDDPRFTTARVTGPSMLSLDGDSHARHRGPFAHSFGPARLSEHLAGYVQAEAARLAEALRAAGPVAGPAPRRAELRGQFAGPLAAGVMAEALGLAPVGVTPAVVLSWYRDIVAAVAALPAASPGMPSTVRVGSFDALAASLREAISTGRAPLLAEAAASGVL